jgi:hypothetical protein
MASGTGTATLDFGAMPGANEASVVVTGISTIGGSAKVEAFLMRSTSASHSANDHSYAALLTGLTCGDVVAGTGFTIYARSTEKLTGQFTVQFVWAD